jgi:hypothetical protein
MVLSFFITGDVSIYSSVVFWCIYDTGQPLHFLEAELEDTCVLIEVNVEYFVSHTLCSEGIWCPILL